MTYFGKDKEWHNVSRDLHAAVAVAAKNSGLGVRMAQTAARNTLAARARVSSTTRIDPATFKWMVDAWLYEMFEMGLVVAAGLPAELHKGHDVSMRLERSLCFWIAPVASPA